VKEQDIGCILRLGANDGDEERRDREESGTGSGSGGLKRNPFGFLQSLFPSYPNNTINSSSSSKRLQYKLRGGMVWSYWALDFAGIPRHQWNMRILSCRESTYQVGPLQLRFSTLIPGPPGLTISQAE
jgi:hypothetical protein